MRTRTTHFLALVLAGALAGGCASTPARFYTLAATARPEGTPSARYAVVVGPVSLPAEVDRLEFVVQVAPNRVALDEFNRWAAPLDDAIARAIAGNLAALLGTPHVGTAAIASVTPVFRVTVDVQRFESIPGEAVLIEAVWAVRKTSGGEPRSGRTIARETVQGKNFDALAAAHSRALATISSDIAAAVRAAAGTMR